MQDAGAYQLVKEHQDRLAEDAQNLK
jgi:hypothetical protein